MDLKENKGAIFKNTKKETDKHPDYKGEIDVNGKRYEIALWLSESAKGVKYFSTAQSEPYVKPESEVTVKDDDDGLPF